MTHLTDEQLMLLEQLTYINREVEETAGIPNGNGIDGLYQGKTVGDLINRFFQPDGNPISKLEALGDKEVSALINGSEMAAILRKIQEDPELMNLELVNKDSAAGAYCFKDSSGEAIVAFRGTTSGEEWYDNFSGLSTEDTKIQTKTLDFIETLGLQDITVIGHSKGGNKSMYCAIVSDKVSRAISMDGQGFSKEFNYKYAEEIKRNASKITNYSLNTDYVHILLYQPEGSRQIYLEGNDYVSGGKNHCPASLFLFQKDENGNWHIEVNSNGSPVLHKTTENEGMAYLHGFTVFVIENSPVEDRDRIGNYLGHIMACNMRPDYHFYDSDGIRYSKDNLTEYIFKHSEELGAVIALVMKYAETRSISDEQIHALFTAMGFGEALETFEQAVQRFKITNPVLAASLTLHGKTAWEILRWFFSNLKDGEPDPIIEKILSWISSWLSKKLGVQLQLDRMWISIEQEYRAIGSVDVSSGRVSTLDTASGRFDYSDETFHILMDTLCSIDDMTSGSIHGWNGTYGSEMWYQDLGISIFTKGINGYSDKIADINDQCRRQIIAIFEKVSTIDHTKAIQVQTSHNRVREINRTLKGIVSHLGY